MDRKTVNEIFARFSLQNPKPETELVYQTHLQLLIAVILSAQATDISVNKVTGHLFEQAPEASNMLELGEEKLKSIIKSIGLYQSKARHIIKTCEILVKEHHGQVPKSREALEALPGVGRKTANVVLNTAFGQPLIAVDTHIFRLANRTKMAEGKTPLAVEKALMLHIDPIYLKHAHHWLVLHGRYICKASKPLCADCLISDLCQFASKTKAL